MRGQGQYADPGYANAQMQQHMSGQRMEQHSSSHQFPEQLEAFTPERDPPYADGHWRWERDGPNTMAPVQGVDLSRSSYYQGLEKQNKDDPFPQTFEGLERKFLDDIMKLDREHKDAEDAEIARHKEKISGINTQYQEKLKVVRGRHASRRDEFLKKESQNQQKHNNNNLQGQDYANIPEAYMTDRHHHHHRHDSYRARPSARDHGFQPRPQYPPPGSLYDRYYQ